jgi:hypothetical protein
MKKYYISMEVYSKKLNSLVDEEIQFVDEIGYNSVNATGNINQCLTFENDTLANSLCDYLNETSNKEEDANYRYDFKVVKIENIK